MRVLQRAYVSAAHRSGEAVTTLDVLAWISAHDNRLFSGATWNNLRYLVTEPTGLRDTAEPAPGPFHPDVPAILREVEWRAHRMPRMPVPGRPRWTSAVRFTLTGALTDTEVPFAGLPHLALAMLRLPDCTGTRTLFPYETARAAAVERLSRAPALRDTAEPYPDLGDVRLMVSPGKRPVLGRLLQRMSRLARVSPLFLETDNEARRQAVRLGHDVVGPAHLLLALLTFDDVLTAARLPLSTGHNRGATLLRAQGVTATDLAYGISRTGSPPEPTADELAAQLDRLRPGDPFEATAEVTARAKQISLARRHPDTGTSHLLLALLDTEAATLVPDPAALRSQVTRDLSAVPPAWQ